MKIRKWLFSGLSELDLLVIQIDGLHVGDHVLVAAIGGDGNGENHALTVVEGATKNTVVVQALLDNGQRGRSGQLAVDLDLGDLGIGVAAHFLETVGKTLEARFDDKTGDGGVVDR